MLRDALRYLSARPNKFQVHAKASLSLLNRKEKDGKDASGRVAKTEPDLSPTSSINTADGHVGTRRPLSRGITVEVTCCTSCGDAATPATAVEGRLTKEASSFPGLKLTHRPASDASIAARASLRSMWDGSTTADAFSDESCYSEDETPESAERAGPMARSLEREPEESVPVSAAEGNSLFSRGLPAGVTEPCTQLGGFPVASGYRACVAESLHGAESAPVITQSKNMLDGRCLAPPPMMRKEHLRAQLWHLSADGGDGHFSEALVGAGLIDLQDEVPRTSVENELTLFSGGANQPHPEKASSGGADSYFCSSVGKAVGVADGVGEWEWRFGVNARAFADELMDGCREFLEGSSHQNLPYRASEKALASLQHGFKSTRSFGSSTAIVAFLDRNNVLGVSNLGDSGLLLLRRKEVDSNVAYRCEGRTKEQQHGFNCPYQLSLVPTPDDFPELLRQGKDKLVRAIQRKPGARSDQPEDSQLQDFQVQEGDLVVLGTDGVLDNLYPEEVCRIATESSQSAAKTGLKLTDPAEIAQAIVEAAFQKSIDRNARTPFADHARQAGLYHTGGKMDDITCVCAWVARSTA